jgi:hexosaminidase
MKPVLIFLLLSVSAMAQTNLALNKMTTVSGSSSSANPGQLAVDGNLTTGWSSNMADSAWMIVDLGSVQTVGGVTILWGANFGAAYNLLGATNCTGVTPATCNFTTALGVTGGGSGTSSDVFAAIQARYILFQGVARSGASYQINEFQVYAPAITPPAGNTITIPTGCAVTVTGNTMTITLGSTK